MKTRIKFFSHNKTIQILSFHKWDINTEIHCNHIATKYKNTLKQIIKWEKI